MAEQHLLNDEAGLNRLPEADVVRDQQVGPRHVYRADQRIELIILDGNTTAEGSLEVTAIRIRRSAPPDGVEERVELLRTVETCDGR